MFPEMLLSRWEVSTPYPLANIWILLQIPGLINSHWKWSPTFSIPVLDKMVFGAGMTPSFYCIGDIRIRLAIPVFVHRNRLE